MPRVKKPTHVRNTDHIGVKSKRGRRSGDTLTDALVDMESRTLSRMDTDGVEDDLARMRLPSLLEAYPEGRVLVDDDERPSDQLDAIRSHAIKNLMEAVKDAYRPLVGDRAVVRPGDTLQVAGALAMAEGPLAAVDEELGAGLFDARLMAEEAHDRDPLAAPGVRKKLKRLSQNARSARWQQKRFGKAGVAMNKGYAKETHRAALSIGRQEDDMLEAFREFSNETGFGARSRAASDAISNGLGRHGMHGLWMRNDVYALGKNHMMGKLYAKLADFDTGMSDGLVGDNTINGTNLYGKVRDKAGG